MRQRVGDALLSRLSELVAAQTGLYFPPNRWRDLEQGINSAARELEFEDANACIDRLLSSALSAGEIKVLASHLTVGESYFLREPRSFEALESEVLPSLIRARRESGARLRIWSAGCARGEEPYSIAILLSRLISDLREWNVTILATDINPRFLQQACAGVYGEWAFRAAPAWLRERYFQRTKEGRWEVLPAIRKMVTFSHLNLAENAYPSLWNNTNAMDVIFCRNVLMYFLPEKGKKVGHNLWSSLVEGGWLIVSPTEASRELFPQFVTVNFPGTILYRKESHAPQKVEGLPLKMEQEAAAWFPPPSGATAERETEAGVLPDMGEVPTPAADPRVAEEDTVPCREAMDFYEQGEYAQAAEKLLAALAMPAPEAAGLKPVPAEIRLVAVGASTGGPLALQTVLAGLPRDFPVPVVIVQHIAPGFTDGFAEWLTESCGLPIHVANHGERILPGHVYLAPDGAQMRVESEGRLALSSDGPENGLRPSVSFLFRSVARVYGPQAVGVLLTGMGKDGAQELKMMRDAGAVTIAQDKESSVVHGMPGEAIGLEAATYVLPPVRMPAVLASLAARSAGLQETPPREDSYELR
jgi:chemotaxis protein methyltransferase CheR